MSDNEAAGVAHIKVMVVSADQHQRLAFSDTVRSFGLTLVDCISPQFITAKHHEQQADVWLIDSQYDESISAMIGTDQSDMVMIGFNTAPQFNETQLYAKWQRKLKRKLADMLNMPELITSRRYEKLLTPWRHVVFIGASMGGPSAVKAFLDHLSPELPICVLLAHHFNPNMIHTLPRLLSRHNDWRCQVVSTSQRLQTGHCLIAPIEQQIVCNSTGRVILLPEPWAGEYKPEIGQLLKNTSDVFGNELIGIIFSGMGHDGSQYLEQTLDNHSQLWAQDPNHSACPSQPQAIIDSGHCQFVGTPEQLAQRLTDMVNAATANTNP